MPELAQSAGCRIAYQRAGKGPPVLFVQGVGVHGAAWRPQIGELAAGYGCLAFDNRGIGQSRPARGAAKVNQLLAEHFGAAEAARGSK